MMGLRNKFQEYISLPEIMETNVTNISFKQLT